MRHGKEMDWRGGKRREPTDLGVSRCGAEKKSWGCPVSGGARVTDLGEVQSRLGGGC